MSGRDVLLVWRPSARKSGGQWTAATADERATWARLAAKTPRSTRVMPSGQSYTRAAGGAWVRWMGGE